jgi:hypothetical protein
MRISVCLCLAKKDFTGIELELTPNEAIARAAERG